MKNIVISILLVSFLYLLTFSSPAVLLGNVILFAIIGLKQNKKALLAGVVTAVILIAISSIAFYVKSNSDTDAEIFLLLFNPLFNTVSRVYEIFDALKKQVDMWIPTLISYILLLLPPVVGVVSYKIKK